jgi:hypothetical protein
MPVEAERDRGRRGGQELRATLHRKLSTARLKTSGFFQGGGVAGTRQDGQAGGGIVRCLHDSSAGHAQIAGQGPGGG